MTKFFIGDIAEKLRLNPRTIRYYERLGMMPNPRRTESGYRIYDEVAVERLEFILKAKKLGLKLDEIKQILVLYDRGQAPCERTQTFITKRITEINQKISDLTSLKQKLEKLLNVKGLKVFPGSICPIIEASEEKT
ncbi:MAG: MerR family DNA-binding protein [Methanosarcina sp.]|nr:MerR family DNA-binding protein [Methanosarcina sp.]